MTIHKVDQNNLPTCEVLAFSIYGMLIGELSKFNNIIYCESNGEQLDEVTHYIHASDLFNHFKTATHAQD